METFYVRPQYLVQAAIIGDLSRVQYLCNLPRGEYGADKLVVFRGGSFESVPNVDLDRTAEFSEAAAGAAHYGHLNVVQYLCGLLGANPNDALKMAATYGHLEVLQYLCDLPGADPTYDNNYAIRFATAFGRLDVVRYLCGLPGVDPTADDNFGMKFAAHDKYMEVVEYLCSIASQNTLQTWSEDTSLPKRARVCAAKALSRQYA